MKKMLSVFMAVIMLFTMLATTSVMSFAGGADVTVVSETEEMGFFQQVGKFFDDIGEAIKKFFEDIGKAFSDFFNSLFGTGEEPTEPVDPPKPPETDPVEEWTEQEILVYFNSAQNKVKVNAKAVQQQYSVNYLAEPTKIGDGLSGIYKMLGGDDWLADTLQANSTGKVTYTGTDIEKRYPVENELWASKLTVDDIETATCTEAKGIYTIKIVTKADAKTANVKHGEGHNPKVFSVVLPETINDNIPGIAQGIIGEVAMNYPSSSVTVTVDAATGHVLTAVYDSHWTINFDKMAASLPFATKSLYEIDW